MGEDIPQVCFAEYVCIVAVDMRYAVGTHLQLVGAFLSTDIEYSPVVKMQYGL